jgi:hypothetical protein
VSSIKRDSTQGRREDGDEFLYEVKAGFAGPAPALRLDRRPRAQPSRRHTERIMTRDMALNAPTGTPSPRHRSQATGTASRAPGGSKDFREIRGPRAAGVVWPVRPRCGKRGGTACELPFRGRGGPLWRAPRRAWRVRTPCRIRALAGLPGRVTPMYLRTAFVHPGAPYVLHGCRESWLRGSDSSPGPRTWETGRAASPANGGAICAARHAARHGQQQPNHGDIALKPTASGFVPAD